MRLSLVGIGAMLRPDDGTAKIVRLIPGGPAETDGRLKAGDKIIAVAQGDEEPVSILHWPLYKAVRLIRGEKDSKVTLTVIPASDRNGVRTKKIDLIRDEVKLEEQAAKSDIKDITTPNGKTHRLGVITLPDFYADFKATNAKDKNARRASSDVLRLVQDLKDEEYVNNHYVIMATKMGQVKKTSLEQYSRPRSNGINAITVKDGDELLEAKLTNGNSQIMLAVKSGKAIRFEEGKTRPMGRNASGVRGIRLKDKKDEVVGMISVNDMDANILVVSENGYGKRSSLEDYRLTNRGGKGVKTISITEKTGKLVTLKSVSDSDDLMIINKSGIAIRMEVEDLRVMGRATQGVKVISLKDGDSIAAVAKVMKDDDDIEDINDIEFTGDAV